MTTPTDGPIPPRQPTPHLRASWARHVEDVTGDPAVEALAAAVRSHWPDPPDHLTADHARRVAADTGEEPVDVLAALIRESWPPPPPAPPETIPEAERAAREAQQAANAVIRDALAHLPADVADRVEAALDEAMGAANGLGQLIGWEAYATTHNLPADARLAVEAGGSASAPPGGRNSDDPPGHEEDPLEDH